MEKLKVEYLNPIDLKPSEYNPREITELDFEKLKNSLREFGIVESVTINKNNEIIGGHMRVKACLELGIKEIPCIRVDLPKKKEKLLNLALNKISGRWDNEKLGVLITELIRDDNVALSGFDDWELEYYNQGVDLDSGDGVDIGGGGIGADLKMSTGFEIVLLIDDEDTFKTYQKVYRESGGNAIQKTKGLIEYIKNGKKP